MLLDEINILKEEVKEIPDLKTRIAFLEEKLGGENIPVEKDKQAKLGNVDTSTSNCKKCKYCEESFPSGKVLKKHVTERQSTKTKCKHCEITFDKNSDLEVHIKMTHESSPKHSCNLCG